MKVYMFIDNSHYELSPIKKILFRVKKNFKVDSFVKYTTNENIARMYINANNIKDTDIKEIEMSYDDYYLFNSKNPLKELKCYKLKSTDEMIIIDKKEKQRLVDLGVIFYDYPE